MPSSYIISLYEFNSNKSFFIWNHIESQMDDHEKVLLLNDLEDQSQADDIKSACEEYFEKYEIINPKDFSNCQAKKIPRWHCLWTAMRNTPIQAISQKLP